jgi:hypothetical protein
MKTNVGRIPHYILCVFTLATGSAACAQSGYQVPRTSEGQPDLQGVWGNNTITPVERPDIVEGREFLSAEEMQQLEGRVSEIESDSGAALFADEVYIAALSGEINSNDPTTGNYDNSWLVERSVGNRTSQIIDPSNGKYPPLSEEGIAERARVAQIRNKNAANGERFETLDSWLDLQTDDRCISNGAPYLDSGYNSYWQIVQSREYVVIVQEMFHDARVIPLIDMPHVSEAIELWHGDSRGYWDGDTLVVETRNYSDKHNRSVNTAELNVERLTRIGDRQLRYLLISHQPKTYTAPFTLELIFDYADGAIFEVACHEGNYAMTNMLRGAREEERRERERLESGNNNLVESSRSW